MGAGVAAVLARTLRPSAFGEVSLALNLAALGTSLGDLGIGQIATREIASHPEERSTIVGSLGVARFLVGLIAGAACAGIAIALERRSDVRLMTLAILATLPLSAASALTVAAQGRLRAERAVLPVLAQSVAWLAVVLILGQLHANLPVYGASFFGCAAIQVVVTILATSHLTTISFERVRTTAVRLLRVAWPLGLAGLFVTAYYRVDGILLYHYRGAVPTAHYSAAYRFLDVLQIVPSTVCGVLLPLLASVLQQRKSADTAGRAIELVLVALAVVALPLVTCGIILAPKLIHLLYGARYVQAVLLLRILLLAFLAICTSYITTTVFILTSLMRPYIWLAAAAAVFNLTANMLTIPAFGAEAAAWSTLATELFFTIGSVFVISRTTAFQLPLRRLWRCGAATIPCAAVTWLTKTTSLPVVVLLAVSVYLPSLVLTRAISIRDIRSLTSSHSTLAA